MRLEDEPAPTRSCRHACAQPPHVPEQGEETGRAAEGAAAACGDAKALGVMMGLHAETAADVVSAACGGSGGALGVSAEETNDAATENAAAARGAAVGATLPTLPEVDVEVRTIGVHTAVAAAAGWGANADAASAASGAAVLWERPAVAEKRADAAAARGAGEEEAARAAGAAVCEVVAALHHKFGAARRGLGVAHAAVKINTRGAEAAAAAVHAAAGEAAAGEAAASGA